MDEDYDVDLAVIGSGGAAMSAAIAARQAGASVLLIERGTLGGTCVNIGCVPSKTLLAAAGARHSAATNPFAGVSTSAGGVDLAALIAQKDELVAGMRQAKYADVAAAYGFEVRHGHARFLDRDTMAVNGQPLRARAYLLATGADPARPDLPGLDEVDYLTSTTAMEQTVLPESLVVIGGGYVGMEQAQLFARLGAGVTIVGRLAPHAEPELTEILREVFADDGITVLEEHATEVRSDSAGVLVTTASGHEGRGQRLLVATGRRPRTEALDLDAGDVKTDGRGFVAIDEHQRTSNPRVFAAGDVTGAPQYVYVAAGGGRVAALNALATSPTEAQGRIDYTGLPAVIFTKPQLASAGLTETEAIERGHVCECRVLGFDDVPRALVNRDTRGALKLVADAETGRVLGVHALGEGAGEIMLAATYAIKASMTVDELADTWAPYLTMAESLRIAAGLFRSQMPTSCCA
ncbi:mercury(II) reductase [Geodermatophilus aquaeductus]|uniref:Mercuric reductase n=1 Tax=Geodermatophilus aquaeductus TaxID=1564161 RepID=A0A521FUM5_9ACTN|nr:mercury(II) reductase [Geodermatophilus aquaeductus]SMO99878.1 mercuric reductase [Geodermatophilus aquaeductus]